MTAQTSFQICSAALVLVGANPITSFDGSSTESTVAGQIYEPTVQALLSLPRWTFAKKWKTLEQKAGTPLARGEVQYHTPADMMTLVAVLDGQDNPVPFTLAEQAIIMRAAGVYLAEYLYRAPESVWPPLFAKAVTSELASLFALAIPRSQELSDGWQKRHSSIDLPRARNVDAQSQTSRRLPTGRFVNVRGARR